MNILLTGATGFLGSHLARALLSRGERVLAYRRRTSALDRLGNDAGRIAWFDLDAGELNRPFETTAIEAIFHAATCYGRDGESVATILETNVHFPLAVFAQAQTRGVPIFLNLHTSLPTHLNAYALSKHQFVAWLRMLEGPTKAAHLALQHFYGPGDDASKFVEWLLRQMLSGAPRIPLTKGEQRRDFLFIDDVVTACLTCLDHAKEWEPNEIVPVGSGNPLKIREIVEACAQIADANTRLDFGAVPYRPGELMESSANISRLCALGWAPRVSLRDGLAAVAGHLREHPEKFGTTT